MIQDYFSADDAQYAAYQAELEFQEFLESSDFLEELNTYLREIANENLYF